MKTKANIGDTISYMDNFSQKKISFVVHTINILYGGIITNYGTTDDDTEVHCSDDEIIEIIRKDEESNQNSRIINAPKYEIGDILKIGTEEGILYASVKSISCELTDFLKSREIFKYKYTLNYKIGSENIVVGEDEDDGIISYPCYCKVGEEPITKKIMNS